MDKLFKHSETEYDFISLAEISVGDTIRTGFNSEGISLFKTVESIVEKRKSKGTWKAAVPDWYKLIVNPIAFTS